MPVTLINVFTVPEDREEEFVKWWKSVKENITKQEGFISGKFHKAIKSDSRYNYINVALWKDEDVYWKAYEKSVSPMKAKLGELQVEMTPALYQVAFEY
jgi:heme oxygenase (mycobilin-producing)